MRFGEKLRKLRVERGMTQAELARQAGLGLRTIANYESGATYPHDRKVYGKLAGILGVEADYLHNENDDFVAQVQEEFGYRGRKGAEKLIREVTGFLCRMMKYLTISCRGMTLSRLQGLCIPILTWLR